MKLTRILFIGLGLLTLILFGRLWFGTGSYPEIWELQQQIKDQSRLNAEQEARNKRLEADVVDLTRDDATIEDHARSELGMVKKGETFYQVILKDDGSEQPLVTVPEPAEKHVE